MDDAIVANLEAVRARIDAACRRCRRSPGEITLVAVTKTVAVERIRQAWALGLVDFGENRVQEARQKLPLLADLGARWHMIGHLQSNKAGQAVALFGMIHSLDSLEIAEHVSRHAGQAKRTLPVLLEVNTGGEESKAGFRLDDGGRDSFIEAARRIASLPGLDVQGLMTVGPVMPEAELARPAFRQLRLLRDEVRAYCPQHGWEHLSMGMTGDFEIAIEEGATILRLGRAIFGARPAAKRVRERYIV